MATQEAKPKTYDRIPNVGLVDDETLGGWMADAVWRRSKADAAAAQYEARKPLIEDKIQRKLIRLHGAVEDYMYRKEMEVNWELIDLVKTHAWLRDEANSLNLAIQTQLALRAALAEQRAKL